MRLVFISGQPSTAAVVTILDIFPNQMRRSRTRRDVAEIGLFDLLHRMFGMLFDIRHGSSPVSCATSCIYSDTARSHAGKSRPHLAVGTMSPGTLHTGAPGHNC